MMGEADERTTTRRMQVTRVEVRDWGEHGRPRAGGCAHASK